MADTTNFNLSKPANGALDWDVDLNQNFDIIDAEIAEAQNLTSNKITTALGFTPEDASKKGVASGYASLNAAGKVPTTQIALNSSLITTGLGFTPEDANKKGAINGYASLDSNGKVPTTQISLTSGLVTGALNYTPENIENKGAANGYASLDANGKVPTSQLNIASNTITGAIGFTPENAALKGVANGYAELDATGKVPNAQITFTEANILAALSFTPESVANKGAANGYASLDASSKVPTAQLPSSLSFSNISNVSISSPSSNQILQYNGTNWVNASVSSGVTTLSGMGDVTISSPSSGQTLQYNGTRWVNTTSTQRATVAVRQTVLAGSVDATGMANFLSVGSGLAVNLAATTTNVVVAFAGGFDSGGAADYVGVISSDVTGAFSSLSASSTVYLYVERNASTGALTYGSTTVAPVYQQTAPASVANLHWFDLSTMQMKLWNGSSWDVKQRVFLGQAVTGASSVTSVITYALRGQYDSGVFAVAANTGYTKNHNLGVVPMDFKSFLRQSAAYQWQDNAIVYSSAYYGGHTAVNSTTAHIGFNTYVGYGNSSGYPSWNDARSFASNGAQTSGEARIVVSRGW